MPQLKKLWSDNPRRVKVISLKKASEQYYFYLQCVLNPKSYYGINRIEQIRQGNFPKKEIKTFQEWLKTEI